MFASFVPAPRAGIARRKDGGEPDGESGLWGPNWRECTTRRQATTHDARTIGHRSISAQASVNYSVSVPVSLPIAFHTVRGRNLRRAGDHRWPHVCSCVCGGTLTMSLPGRTLATMSGLVVSIAIAGAQSAGTLDPRFGGAGKVTSDFFRAADEILGLALAPDGSLVAAGSVFNPGRGFDFGVARYSADGVLSSLAAIDFHPGRAINDEAVAVAALADGRIVVAGRTSSDGVHDDF